MSDPYPADMAPSRYIEKVSLATGEILDDEIEPRQLLVHSHRDYHVVDVQARWIMSRLVDVIGDEELVVHGMKGVRKLALKTRGMLGKLIGEKASTELARRLLGLEEHEYYFRYKKNPLSPAEATKRVRDLQHEAQERLARATDDGNLRLRVLLTGGTGFVGKEVIAQAARHPDIAELVVLIRPRTIRDRKTGEVVETLTPADRGADLLRQLWLQGEDAARVRFVAGDIEQPNLGIDDDELETLKSTITHVIHSAASVAFDDPYEESFRANVYGSKNALAFAKQLQDADDSPFVAHIGIETSYIHGRQTRQAAREDEVVFPRNFYNNYYELTKALASIETERYMLEEGLRAVQLCPSIVIGQSDTGNNRGDTKVVNAPVNLFGRVRDAEEVRGAWRERSKARLLASMAARFPADPSAQLNLIPVDWVARGIIAALKHPEAVGERVHLATDNRLTSQEISDIVAEELEVEVHLAEPTMHRNVTLPALTKVLESAGQERVASALQKLGDVFGGYSEWGQPVHQVGKDQSLLGMPEQRPVTRDAFRLLCRHNRWVQDFGRVRDLDEIARRERLWSEVLEELAHETDTPVAQIEAEQFRHLLHERIDLDTFTRRVGSAEPVGTSSRREPLAGVDTAWLQMDHPANRMIINAMVLLDAPLDADELRAIVEERLLHFDRFRQRVVAPEGFETIPAWEDDPGFDLDQHVVVETLDESGDDTALNALVDRVVSEGLDAERPPWRLHVVQGWEGGGALIARLHHCLGDGAALVYVLLSLTDAVDLATDEAPPSGQKERRGTSSRLARMVERSRVALHEHIAPLADPRRSLELAGTGIEGAAALGKLTLMSADPKTVFRGELGVQKRTAWSGPIALDEVKAVKSALGATVNDVLMAALAGALRSYLIERGEDPTALRKLRAVVPIHLRPPDEKPELGNRFGLVFLELPVGLEHELQRLDAIQKTMTQLKSSVDAAISLKALQGMGHLHEVLEDQALRLFTAKASLVASNVPGPYEPLYLAGEKVKSCMFWVPQSGDIGVGVSILSYAGEIRVGVMSDANIVPDPGRLIAAFEAEVETLCHGLSR